MTNKEAKQRLVGGIEKEVDPYQVEGWNLSYWAMLKENFHIGGGRIIHERTIKEVLDKAKEAEEI